MLSTVSTVTGDHMTYNNKTAPTPSKKKKRFWTGNTAKSLTSWVRFRRILGDPGGVSQVGEKARQKLSSTGKRAPGYQLYSHRTISKNSTRCRLLIGHKKCFVLLCSIGEQLLPSWALFVSLYNVSPHLPGSFTKLERARETFIFYFPDQKRRNDESKKRLGCYQQEQFNLAQEHSVFDRSQCIVNNRKF